MGGIRLSIDDPRLNQSNGSCFSDRLRWRYEGVTVSPSSALIIIGGSLRSNQTYQFLLEMQNKRNQWLQVVGSLLVEVHDTESPTIVIRYDQRNMSPSLRSGIVPSSCVVSVLCMPNVDYQLINPTTQVALLSFCFETCPSVQSITWAIYQGHYNASSNLTQWSLFPHIQLHQDVWFFGKSSPIRSF